MQTHVLSSFCVCASNENAYIFIRGLVQIMGTIIVGGILLALIALAFASMAHDKKNGKSIQCGGDCKHCSGRCH